MTSQGPASNEVLVIVFQRLSPRSVTACRAVCLRWSELLSSLCLEFLADVDDGNADSSACFAGLGGGRGAFIDVSLAWFVTNMEK
ncbi:hypothetical protein ZEAMMB73_Zm00001d045924 [Zea mays]|uniref:F-box domain-containing protein n=1 Tax=Zea mays TaxID=4577 RepID=A0A1D6NZV2_MAIZE|nr:hypothetical protein ZEAMMB73_Zm00001d045924 [Zea mays]